MDDQIPLNMYRCESCNNFALKEGGICDQCGLQRPPQCNDCGATMTLLKQAKDPDAYPGDPDPAGDINCEIEYINFDHIGTIDCKEQISYKVKRK